MSPIFTYPNSSGSGGSCVCEPAEKFWYWQINPVNYGFGDMLLWTINGNDFIIGVNTVMTGLGGSGTVIYLGGTTFASVQQGWIAFYGLFEDLPTFEVKDPSGIIIDPVWSTNLVGQCQEDFTDYPQCAVFSYPKASPFVSYINLQWFSEYMFNTLTGYPVDDGTNGNEINIFWTFGVPIDLNSPTAASDINNIISPMFLNNTSVTITPSGTHLDLKISNFYGVSAGFYIQATNQWRTALRTLVCP